MSLKIGSDYQPNPDTSSRIKQIPLGTPETTNKPQSVGTQVQDNLEVTPDQTPSLLGGSAGVITPHEPALGTSEDGSGSNGGGLGSDGNNHIVQVLQGLIATGLLADKALVSIYVLLQAAWSERREENSLRTVLERMMEEFKKQGISKDKERIENEKKSAWMQLGAAVASTVVSLAFSFFATRASYNLDPSRAKAGTEIHPKLYALSEALRSASQGFGQITSQTMTAADKQSGFGKAANEAQLAKSELDLAADIAKQGTDRASEGSQESKDTSKQALEFIKQLADLQKQAVTKIANM